MQYIVAVLPIKEGYPTKYVAYDGWTLDMQYASWYSWREAINKRDELQKEPGLSEAGRESIVVTTYSPS